MSRLKNNEFLGKFMFVIGLLLLWSLVKGFWGFRKAYRRVDEAKEVLKAEEIKNQELEDKLKEVQKEDYIERVIRNELNMQKEGETVVVLPDNEFLKVLEPDSPIEEEKRPKEKWLDLVR